MKRLVIIGNGMAGTRLVDRLVQLAPDLYQITVFGDEPYPGYDRIQLSRVLSGAVDPAQLFLNDGQWYQSHGVVLRLGEPVVEVDVQRQAVKTQHHEWVGYDELVFATGSSAVRLPLPGADLPGVVTFRTLDDCAAMTETARPHANAVVIGGGLLGLEAAHGLLALGMDVTVLHAVSTLMERQLDASSGAMLLREMQRQGMRCELNASTVAIRGTERVQAVELADGRIVPADLVVMAVGIRPNVHVARAAGLEVNRGIVVNDFLETSAPHVYAVGECAEHAGMLYGIVAPLYEQVEVLVRHLAGFSPDPYQGSVLATKLKVSGVEVFSVGEFQDDDTSQALVLMDSLHNRYRKAVFRNGQLVGAILYGDTAQSARYSALVRQRVSAEEFERTGLWGDSNEVVASSVESWSADEIVCGCMGVTKGTIVHAITEKGLDTVDQVRLNTGASRSCGSCRPLVSQLLSLVTGRQSGDQPDRVCSCTSLSHEAVVDAIRAQKLLTVADVMRELQWSNPEGCSKCRPALNYYVRMAWPHEAVDDPRARFVNERLHANIQRDGTFSVVPRIYGGVTTADQLRTIADVAEKFQVPMIKITGGQRIDLLGVRKEDLPAVWEELGMPSGYAYGKAMRTVKTCVGTDFCRFGTQDAIGAGIRLERALEGMDTPHKVKMAVSGCPRNCAESTVKDVGVIGVEGGYDIYVGGNGGAKVRAADFLTRVHTQDEVEEWTLAFLQYYRENARYLERTAAWVERQGLSTIRDTLNDAEKRRDYAQRLRDTLAARRDPWERIVTTPEERQRFATVHVTP